jgi:hypothetical protein
MKERTFGPPSTGFSNVKLNITELMMFGFREK